MILIKLGGSVITDKTRYHTVRMDVLERLCGEIAASGKKVAIVHGAGSFGHIIAHKYDLVNGLKNDAQITAVAAVSRDMRELNLMVLNSLIDAGIAPISIPPSACFRLKGGRLDISDVEIVRRYLDIGISPVLFGDVLLDDELGFSICSGDQLIAVMAKKLFPEKVIFVSDIDGIMDRDPADPAAMLIKELRQDEIKQRTFTSKVKDVTGGIWGKMETMFDLSAHGLECILINGMVPGRLRSALEGKEVVGTRIRKG